MNILLVDQYSDLGGAQRCLLDLLPAIRERGWQAHLAVPGAGPLVRAAEALGVTVDSIPSGPYSSGRKSGADFLRFAWDLPRLAARLEQLARRFAADLVYVNGPRVLPAAAWAARRRLRVPMLFHCHSYLPQRSAAWLAGQSLRAARATVVAACRFAVWSVAPYLDPERIHVIHNAAAEGSAAPRRFASNGCWRIGVIGRLAPEKGQAELLRAARLLAPEVPHCRFVVCGDALFSDRAALRYARQLQELAVGLPADFLGWQDDVYAVLAGLDLLVVPSLREPGAPRVILEAYASGVPVVAFPTGGIPEVVTDEKTGFLVEPATPEALASRVRGLIERPASLKKVAESARALWREQFTLERYRRQILELMERAAAETATPPAAPTPR